MQHPILGIILYLVMGLFALAAAYYLVAQMVDKVSLAKLKTLALVWALVLLLFPLPEAYLASFVQDKNVTYLSKLAREWPFCAVLLGGISISLYRRCRKHSL